MTNYLMHTWTYNKEKGNPETKVKEYILYNPINETAVFERTLESLAKTCIEENILNGEKFEIKTNDDTADFDHGWDSELKPAPQGRIKEFKRIYERLTKKK